MTDDLNAYETSWARAILAGLQGKQMYEGTVPEHVKARRRARNKVARLSRRVNRR
jgi:hypothetical protein